MILAERGKRSIVALGALVKCDQIKRPIQRDGI